MPQQVFFQSDLGKLKNVIKLFRNDKVLVVRGKNSYFKSSANVFVEQLLDGIQYNELFDFESNPQWEQVLQGLEVVRKENPKLICAVGGGSVLDMAKILSVFAFTDPDDRLLLPNQKFNFRQKIPVLAIPTTAGSGSEATQFAVVYHNNIKYSIDNALLLPEYVYLSGKFSENASPYLIAITGLDAFFQAAESIWSINSSNESEYFALESLKITWDNLLLAINKNPGALENMQLSAHLAGKAINFTRTTAPHAISYAFTTFYGIPHGHAVALSFPFFIHYNYFLSSHDCNDPRGVGAVKHRMIKIFDIIGCNAESATAHINDFLKELGVETSIYRLIPNFNPEIIIQNVNMQRLSNNPRAVNLEDVLNYLRQ